MVYRTRIKYTATQRAEIWDRWQPDSDLHKNKNDDPWPGRIKVPLVISRYQKIPGCVCRAVGSVLRLARQTMDRLLAGTVYPAS